MNILIIGKFSEDQFGFHISETLKEIGHTTLNFVPLLEYKSSKTVMGRRLNQLNHLIYNNLINTQFFREQRKKKLSKLIGNSKIDLTICSHDFLYPDEVTILKDKTKSPVVMWFPDSVAGFQKGLFFISDYDFIFFKDPYIVQILQSDYNKKNVYYLPECCNPKYHKTVDLNSEDINHYGCDITTYGNPHNIRSSFFKQLIANNYKIKIWGHQPPIWLNDNKIKSMYKGEYVFNESKAKSVLAAKVNLNTLHPTEINSLNARTFEIAGIGGFQILHWRAGLSDLFEDGKELVSFKNFAELIEKINYYLEKPEERKIVAKAGQLRAYKDHTYKDRLKLLLDTVLGGANGFETPLIKSLKNY